MRGRGEDMVIGKRLEKEREKSDLIESLPRTTQSRKLKPTIQVSCEPKSGLIQKPYIWAAQVQSTRDEGILKWEIPLCT